MVAIRQHGTFDGFDEIVSPAIIDDTGFSGLRDVNLTTIPSSHSTRPFPTLLSSWCQKLFAWTETWELRLTTALALINTLSCMPLASA